MGGKQPFVRFIPDFPQLVIPQDFNLKQITSQDHLTQSGHIEVSYSYHHSQTSKSLSQAKF